MSDVPAVQDYFNARELANLAKRLGYLGLPHTKQGVLKHVEREGWDQDALGRCRRRPGRGGGNEYHISLVPRLESLLAVHRTLMAETAVSRAVVPADTMPPVTMMAKKRGVADARGQILTAIIGYASRHKKKLSQGITDFLLAQEGHAAWLDACRARDSGEFLTLSHKLKLKEGSPLASLPPADEPEKNRTSDNKYPFGFGVSEEILVQANDRSRKGDAFQKVSRSTLYAWLKAYQERGFGALVPDTTKKAEPIPIEFETFMRFYALPAKPDITSAYARYVAASNSEPLSLEQIKYILRSKLSHLEKAKGREGRLALRSRMAFVSRDTSDILPTTIYVGDGHTFDARIEDPVSRAPMRPEITAIIDVATRRAVGWAISRKENVIAVTEALKNACVAHGIPAVVYFDRGAGYKNKRFDDEGNGLMSRLDITKMHALPYGSQAKGNIERSHQSLWIPFAKELPTYLGADMDKEARLKVDKQLKADRRDFGHSKLLMPWDEFRQECQRRIDEYNDRPHSELPRFVAPDTGRIRHMSPNEYWQSHVDRGFEAVLVDPFTMDDLFRPYEKRTVSRCLIDLWTNEYFSLDLNPYHKQEVYVGYDYNQADRVWVREIDRATGGVGKLICVAAYGGNKVSYMPKTFLESSIERREKGRLKRNDDRRRDIEAERIAPFLLEETAIVPAPFLDAVSEPEPIPSMALVVDNANPEAVQQVPRRRVFASDEELATWALGHPGELSPNQIKVLRKCVSSPVHRDLFRMSGIDLDALETLIRAVA